MFISILKKSTLVSLNFDAITDQGKAKFKGLSESFLKVKMLYIDIQNLEDFPKMRIIIILQFDIATMGASCMMNLGKEKGRFYIALDPLLHAQ